MVAAPEVNNIFLNPPKPKPSPSSSTYYTNLYNNPNTTHPTLSSSSSTSLTPTPSQPQSQSPTSYDISPLIIPSLDRHLVLPLLDFLENSNLRNHEDVLRAKYELLKGTNMVTYVMGLHNEVFGEADDEVVRDFQSRESSVKAKLSELQEKALQVMEIISNPEVVDNLRQDKMQNLRYLEEKHKVTLDQINHLYHFGQYQYTVGHYPGASDYLYHFRVLSPDPTLLTSSMWGKLTSDILEGSWESAQTELDRLRENIESRFGGGSIAQGGGTAPISGGSAGGSAGLKERTWWLHWSLYVFWNKTYGRQSLVESWLSQTYLNTIQTSSPHLLRYLVAAFVISRSPSSIQAVQQAQQAHAVALAQYQAQTTANQPTVDENGQPIPTPQSPPPPPPTISPRTSEYHLREIVKVLTQETYQYSDPITEFLRLLLGEVDFERAREELGKVEDVIGGDFFLDGYGEEFLEGARGMVSEVYCRIHRRIDINDLSDRLGMSPAEGERWIVNLVRDAKLDAKIDLKENTVDMNHPTTSPYQTVIERTKGILIRSQAISTALDLAASGQSAENIVGVAGGGGGGGQGGGGRGGRGRGRGGRGGRGGGRGRGGGGGGGDRGGSAAAAPPSEAGDATDAGSTRPPPSGVAEDD